MSMGLAQALAALTSRPLSRAQPCTAMHHTESPWPWSLRSYAHAPVFHTLVVQSLEPLISLDSHPMHHHAPHFSSPWPSRVCSHARVSVRVPHFGCGVSRAADQLVVMHHHGVYALRSMTFDGVLACPCVGVPHLDWLRSH
jgi:hypothetical protein